MRYVLSVAFKLFTIRLVIAVGLTFINQLSSGLTTIDWPQLFMLLASAIVLLAIVNNLPETVAGIINGSHTGSGVGLAAAAGAAAGAVAGTASAAAKTALGGYRTGSTVSNAVKIASLNGAKGFGGKTAGAAGELWGAWKAARQQEGAAGGLGSTFRRMRTDTRDMHDARKAMTDPNYQQNPYRTGNRNPYNYNPNPGGAPSSSRASGSGGESSEGDGSGQSTPGNPT